MFLAQYKFGKGVLLVACLFLLTTCKKKQVETAVEIVRPVKYATIGNSSDALTETFSGSAQSSKDAALSFKVGGTITKLAVKVGDQVRRGQMIAQIDQTDYSVQYQQSVANNKSAETQIKSAETQMINSKATYERVEKLYENNSVSLSEFEQAKSGYELAVASYNAALAQATASEKQVESAQNQVNYARLTAPFSGIITNLNVEENELVGTGTPVAMISAIGDPEISVGIPEVYIAKIKKDQAVEIQFSSIPAKIFMGKVYEVGYSSLGGSTYPVTVRIDEPTGEIRPGMVADVSFNFSTSDAPASQVVAPAAAVGEDPNGNFVFVLKQEGERYLVQKQVIQVGALTPAGFVVQSGLDRGDLVATAGLNTLLNGMKVRLMD